MRFCATRDMDLPAVYPVSSKAVLIGTASAMPDDYLKSLQSGLAPAQRLSQIVEHSMCIGCGICQGIVGPEKITLEVTENGNLRPVAGDSLSHEDMDRVIDVCPGTRIDGMPDSERTAGCRTDEVWGVWHDICFCWSADPGIRHMAATGGALTAIGLYLLESGEIDFLVHARASGTHPALGERHISRTRQDVLSGSGSRYGPTPTLLDISDIIESADRNNENFAFVGTPCDVSALRNYSRHEPRVSRYCRSILTMVCGGFMELSGTRERLAAFGIEYRDVASLRYRGYGCPGPTVVATRDGRTVSMNYLDYWGKDESTWNLPPRCKVCPDGIGDAADIAAADTWDGGSPPQHGQEDDPGVNAVLARTQRGREIMDRAIAAGYLVRGDSLTCEDLNRLQPHQANKKRAVWARFQGLKDSGRIVPLTSGLRLESLHDRNRPEFNERERQGTRRRVAEGRFSEPTPKRCRSRGCD